MGLIKNIFTYPFRLYERRKIKKYFDSLSISNIDSLNGYDFEEYVCMLFEACGFQCDTTPKSKDNGVDIVAFKNNIKIAIQTKLYFKHNVSNSAVQEVYTGCKFYNCDIPIVITNSNFSAPAKTLAESLKVLLIDRKLLSEITNSTFKDKKYILESIIYNYICELNK